MSDGKTVLGKLSRLFKRNPSNNFMAELHARAINTPLFVQADLGSQLINAYLHGPQPQQAVVGDSVGEITVRTEDGIAIMDISGALTSRTMHVPCQASPVSYEQIREELAEQVADANTKAIVLRLDTPGGEAAQNIDLHDFIYSMRGDKQIIAMVDDMAYSAGYAIASACDEIWVTRTGGVGSVGVVTYHVDQSEFNSKVGIKVEFIHAGARKVEGNPHQPLTEGARSNIQERIDQLYDMFSEAVARGRGLTVEQVKATEAGTFIGAKAIEVGFADVLGTFNDLMAYLSGGEKPTQPELKMTADDSDPAAEEGQAPVAAIGAGSGDAPMQEDYDASGDDTPELPETVMTVEGMSEQAVAEAVGEAVTDSVKAIAEESTPQATESQKRDAQIRAMCTAAGIADMAQDFIDGGESVEQVRADLIDLRQAGEVEVESSQKVSVSEPTETGSPQLTVSGVYARRNKRNKRGK